MSGELIVNDSSGTKPRVGGFEFMYDAVKGLWRTPELLAGGYYIDLPYMMPQWGRTVVYSGGAPGPSAPPPSASALWNHPETITTEIVAYRAWNYTTRISDDGFAVKLRSLHHDFVWDGPVVTADEVPTAGNVNGLYAIRGDEHHRNNFDKYINGERVWGRVALSGIVVECEYGYRAERMTIQELWVSPDEPSDADDENADEDKDSLKGLCRLLGDRYQCDVSVRAASWEALTESKEEA